MHAFEHDRKKENLYFFSKPNNKAKKPFKEILWIYMYTNILDSHSTCVRLTLTHKDEQKVNAINYVQLLPKSLCVNLLCNYH